MINASRGIEAAATAEVGPRVTVSAGTFDGGEFIRFATDDGFQWDEYHMEGDPPHIPWVVIRRFVRAYRAWFDEKADELLHKEQP